MSTWLMNMVNGVSCTVRRSPLFVAENAVSAPSSGTLPGQFGRARWEVWWGTLGLALLASACAAPAEPDDWGDGDQVTLTPRVDWSGRGVPDGGWADAGPVVVEYDAGEEAW